MSDPSLETPPPAGPRSDPFREGPAAARARRWRSIVIALALIAFVVLVFITSVVRLSSHAHTPA